MLTAPVGNSGGWVTVFPVLKTMVLCVGSHSLALTVVSYREPYCPGIRFVINLPPDSAGYSIEFSSMCRVFWCVCVCIQVSLHLEFEAIFFSEFLRSLIPIVASLSSQCSLETSQFKWIASWGASADR